jgi:mRNA-degrading endonuclease RelE of RelBE toxin-antitoxin system
VKWLICWSSEAARDLDRLDPNVADRVTAALDQFAIEGDGDVRRLAAIQPPEYRLRVGKWRVRFQIDYARETLYVMSVLLRDKAY